MKLKREEFLYTRTIFRVNVFLCIYAPFSPNFCLGALNPYALVYLILLCRRWPFCKMLGINGDTSFRCQFGIRYLVECAQNSYLQRLEIASNISLPRSLSFGNIYCTSLLYGIQYGISTQLLVSFQA